MATKTKGIVVDLYAPFARWRTDLLRIEARCFGPMGDSDEKIEEQVKEALFLAVIREGDTAFGYALMDRRWPESAYLSIVAVDPAYQGKGHLGTLLGAVEGELRAVGYTHLEVDARISTLAPHLEKHYGERVEAQFEHGSNIGPLRFMRIRLA